MKKYKSQHQAEGKKTQQFGSSVNSEKQSKEQIQGQRPEPSYFEALLKEYLKQNTQNSSITNSVQMISNEESCNIRNCNQSCNSGMISSLYAVMTSQTQFLQQLNKKVQQIMQKNKELVTKVAELQAQNRQLRTESSNKKVQPEIIKSQHLGQLKLQNSQVNKDILSQILFGKQKYSYMLVLKQPISQPLYRQRNFNISIELVDQNNKTIRNPNKIPMSLAIYTCQTPPKFIEKNTLGQKLLKGYVDQALINGVCLFEKIQIREVTSHYRGGWIFLVIIPCMSPLGTHKTENYIDFKQIRPLIIQQVVVKAKKPKKQNQKKDEEDDDQQQ